VNTNFIRHKVKSPVLYASSTKTNHTKWIEGFPKSARYVLEQITSQPQSNTWFDKNMQSSNESKLLSQGRSLVKWKDE